jgi:hopene-associated glycosyltransferase HpnB
MTSLVTAFAIGAGFASAAIWLYLLTARGQFWRDRPERVDFPQPADWPRIAAVIPARNEAGSIGMAIRSLTAQDYPGEFGIVIVDDDSDDGTGDLARAAATEGVRPVVVLRGTELQLGWTGKMWAVSQGVAEAEARFDPDFLLLTDADIVHHKENLRELVARAQAEKRDLVSLMAKLRCGTFAERALLPAFVYFFDMVYPFRWVADPHRPVAAAAGGCMLVRRTALNRIGGIVRIKAALIDDCMLAAAIKSESPGGIWLGLTNTVHCLRAYNFGDVWQMVSRAAFTQLDYSTWKLAGTVLALFVTFLAPPLLFWFAQGWVAALGAFGWLSMAASFQPILWFYGRSPLWGLALPFIAAVYLGATIHSALRYWQGKGGLWKGRAQAHAIEKISS